MATTRTITGTLYEADGGTAPNGSEVRFKLIRGAWSATEHAIPSEVSATTTDGAFSITVYTPAEYKVYLPSGYAFTLDVPAGDAVDLESLRLAGEQLPDMTSTLTDWLNALDLTDISDVNAAAPTDGQALVWDNSAGEWIPGDLATTAALTAHTDDEANPHSVTAAQVGAYTTAQSDALFDSVLTSFTYYVDATGGSDAGDGLTSGAAWQTLGKVGTELAANTIKPGDRVLFKRGETWTGESLIVGRSGLANYPIIFGAYGAGAKPIFDGDDTDNCIIATSKSYLTFANLDCRNGYTSGAVFTTCTNVAVLHCDMSGAGNDNLIFISNCEDCVVVGGTYADAYRRDAGFFATGIEITDGGDNFLIADVTCTNNADAGITVHNHGAGDPQGLTAVPTNVRIVNATCNANLGNGINCMVQGASAAADIIIEGAVCNNNVGTGIRIHRAGAGVGAAYWDGATITTPTTLTNTGYGMWIEADNITLDNWLSTSNQGLNLKDSVNFVCNNFTCYSNPASAQWPVFVTGARMNGSTFRNGIIYQAFSGGQVFGYAANSMTGADVDYMMFYFPNYTTQARWMWNGSALTYANWLATSGQNANGIQTVTNPLFVSVPSDLTLQAGSPAIDAGVDVGLPYTGPAPDLGYAERA